MLSERQFEDIICKYPELIEEGLIFKGRQVLIYRKKIDILFEDKFGQKLIVELKIGPIDRKHIGQVMEYEGGILSIEDPTVRIMLVGNRVPPNLKKALDYHEIEWKEISLLRLKEFLNEKNDIEFLKYFSEKTKSGVDSTKEKVRVSDMFEETVLKDISFNNDSVEVSVQAFLDLIEDINVLGQVNKLRERIKNIDRDIYEYARKWTWIYYKVASNGRQFCGLDIYKRHFIACIHIPRDWITPEDAQQLDIRNLKDKHYVKITVHLDTNLDLLCRYIVKAYK